MGVQRSLPGRLGPALIDGGRWSFCVWAPLAASVQIHFASPEDRLVELVPHPRGYWTAVIDDVHPGARYRYVLDKNAEFADPASRYQPDGVHGPSMLVSPNFGWDDAGWRGLPLHDFAIYELHTGTFTPEGTFDAVIAHLAGLAELGVTVIELMPVAQFPGARNWGYDGVYPFAVQSSYGGPKGLKRLVNACHQAGLAVALDVVYNHLGPEGNYIGNFGPYFTGRYQTPWGPAVNFDGPDSDEVRRYFVENALYWLDEFHIDALRLDAVHAIFDNSARPFLEELGGAVHEFAERSGRRCYAIAESDLNDPRLVASVDGGGFGLDAVWNDEFHHSLRVLLTGERSGYYSDFGELRQLEKAYGEGFVHSGEYSEFRRRRHGRSSAFVPGGKMVVFAQNHDQVGNRMLGERLTRVASYESTKLAAAAVLLSPFVPLLFMGEEYGEEAPFLYFVDHSDPNLIDAVRNGRKQEFASFAWQGQPPDPQDAETFLRSKLDHDLARQGRHAALRSFYTEALRLRRTNAALAGLSKDRLATQALPDQRTLAVRRWIDSEETVFTLCFSDVAVTCELTLPPGRWRLLLDSSDPAWLGSGPALPEEIKSTGRAVLRLNPRAAALYRKEA